MSLRFLIFYFLFIHSFAIAQDDIELQNIKAKLDSALSFEGELRIKTAQEYFQSLEEPVKQKLVEYPQNSALWRIQGIIQSRTSSIESAYKSLKRSVLLDSLNLENQIEYIRFTTRAAQKIAGGYEQLKSQRWLQNAFNVCAAALERHPKHAVLHELVGDIYAATNDIENCTYHYWRSYNANKTPELALKLYRLYAVNQDYTNEVKMAGILNSNYSTYAEFYAVQSQLGIESIELDFEKQSRYLPGVSKTIESAIKLKSRNPQTYHNYFKIIKMSYANEDGYQANKSEVISAIESANSIFFEMDEARGDILIEGAVLLKDMGFESDACKIFQLAQKLGTDLIKSYDSFFCK